MTQHTRPLVFIGGIFHDDQASFIRKHSRSLIQYAADALQKKLIEGLSKTYPGEMSIINSPFVGAFPRAFSAPRFPALRARQSGVPMEGQEFTTRGGLRFLSRLSGISRLLRAKPRDAMLVVYSANTPLLYAAIMFRLRNPESRLCLLLPDLPEYMGGSGRLHAAFKAVEVKLFYRAVKRVDCFVLLAEAMAARLGIGDRPYVVVEGIADEPASENAPVSGAKRVFLYSGTLAEQYGVKDLLAAFQQLDRSDSELWICGEGDSRAAIETAALQDPRIKFFGQVDRTRALELQKQATILVNPRTPVGDYTKYSFPSKTLEYMATGRTVVMHDLPGMPAEYRPYFLRPQSADVSGLAKALSEAASMTNDDLNAFGNAARLFVLSEKNPVAQARRISSMLSQIA